jgi:hypothetical protein
MPEPIRRADGSRVDELRLTLCFVEEPTERNVCACWRMTEYRVDVGLNLVNVGLRETRGGGSLRAETGQYRVAPAGLLPNPFNHSMRLCIFWLTWTGSTE